MRKIQVTGCDAGCQTFVLKLKYPNQREPAEQKVSINKAMSKRFDGEWVAEFPDGVSCLSEAELEVILKIVREKNGQSR